MKRPQLAHVGIFARDVDALVAFYCDVFDMHVTDHGVTAGVRVAFLSADPAHHHQLVIAAGRGGDQKSTLAQLSFLLPDLDGLRDMLARIKERGLSPQRIVDHGTSWSVYVLDPEENIVELYVNTSWYIAQPHAVPLDLSLTDEEITAKTLERCQAESSFKSAEQWRMDFRSALARGHGRPA